MPSRTRANKPTKSLKENINVGEKTRRKAVGKIDKPLRRALADKTNSASDDNTSIEVLKVIPKKPQPQGKTVEVSVKDVNKGRPCRERRLPGRFNENQALKKLSHNNSLNRPPFKPNSPPTPTKSDKESPFKTPPKSVDISIVVARPRRVCRLPSRLEDHSISPNKFIPVKPVQASTPKVQKPKNVQLTDSIAQKVTSVEKTVTPSNKKKLNPNNKVTEAKKSKTNDIKIADTNNNAKQGRPVRSRRLVTAITENVIKTKVTSVSPKKSVNSPVKKSNKQEASKDFSFRILEDKKQKEIKDKGLDVYEFTFDPTEEPPKKKKKPKRVTKKKPAQPKAKQILYKNNYDKNVAKALTALKNVVSKKNSQAEPKPVENTQINKPQTTAKVTPITPSIQVTKPVETTADKTEQNNTVTSQPAVQNSIRIEDIAADFEPSVSHELNYSPINSPHPNKTPAQLNNTHEGRVALNQDPLNLKENLSFFDEVPAASSSMNSTRHPHASPWRVEFNNLPIKWHVNSYVKPNMTPAVECSFVNFDDSKKKHVYTNMVPETGDSLPEIVENERPNLIQTSIISFIREVAEKKANKKRGRSATPQRAKENEAINSEFNKTPRKVATPKKPAENGAQTPDYTSNKNKENATPNEKCRENLKRKLDEDLNAAAAKTSCKRNDNNNTFFGFDDTENSENLENVSPKKMESKRTLRPRARGVLKQINEQVKPTRALIPVTTKPVNSEVVNKLFEEMKTASDAPLFPEKENLSEKEITNVFDGVDNELMDGDSDSVHLFEDIEVVHHMKAQRKSYGKAAKKVAFNQNSDSESDSQSALPPIQLASDSEEDDLADLTFEMPNVKEKKARKKTKKTKMSKKEAEEADAWAASFNSMCEDIDEFPLVVE